MATIKDVARLAGVSPATVSRVTSGATNVNEKTRQKILDAINKLSYYPNTAARALASRKTGAIGILLNRMEDPFYYDLIRGFNDGSVYNDTNIVFCTFKEEKYKKKYVDYLTNGITDGIILYGSYFFDKETIARLTNMDFPLLVIESPQNDLDVDNIYIDNYEGVFQAVEYLVELGHKQIALISGNLNKKNSIDRSNGYFSAMHKNNLSIRRDYVCNLYDDDYSAGYDAMEQFLKLGKERPTAVVCGDDAIACYAITAAESRGLSVPNDISVIGFDDQRILPFKYTGPDITTIQQPLYQIGFDSIGIIKNRIEQASKTEHVSKAYKTNLIVRDSTGKPNIQL